MTVFAGVVTYNPEKERLQENLSALVGQVDKILVFDNASTNKEELREVLEAVSKRIPIGLRLNEQNAGMAVALNGLCERACQQDATHILLLDQDSVAQEGMVRELVAHAAPNIGIVCPHIRDRNDAVDLEPSHDLEELGDTITSGSLVNLDAWSVVGGYDENLFVDWVDHEFCDNLRAHGYRIVGANGATLLHEIGKKNFIGYGWTFEPGKGFSRIPQYSNERPYFRRYDMMRGQAYTARKYRGTPLGHHEQWMLFAVAVHNFWRERRRGEFARALVAGVADGRRLARTAPKMHAPCVCEPLEVNEAFRDAPSSVRMGFVVLHYQTYDMTMRCVNALLRTFGSLPIAIVVVDNASPDGSGAMLAQYYRHNAKVEVLSNKKNLGFAQGNNVGYAWMRTTYDPDFVVVMNSDVLIDQQDFVDEVARIYEEDGFAVLGPDIVEPQTGAHKNPHRMQCYTKQEAGDLLRSMECWDACFLPRYAQLSLLRELERRKAATSDDEFLHPWRNAATECVLQGSCYVFSRDYTRVRAVAFCPQTFLYFEEFILARDCEKLGLVMRYSPDVRVVHLGGVSTGASGASLYARERKKNREHLASVRVFIDRYDATDVANG